jgi:uncharacterized protein YcfJ
LIDRLPDRETIVDESVAEDGPDGHEELRAEYAQKDGNAGGAVVGAVVGAGVGAVVAGPVGVVVGLLVGAVAGEVAGSAQETHEHPEADET